MAGQESEMRHVFVYGTLKRGQCRQTCWPKEPQRICNAWTLGRLIDLGAYPALLRGTDRVWGELWSFNADDIEIVHQALDRVEVCNQPGLPNEYDRVPVRVTLTQGAELVANTYRFADEQQAGLYPTVPPTLSLAGQLYVVWPT